MFKFMKDVFTLPIKMPPYVPTPDWTENMELREASGTITLTDPLDCFLYMLLREHLHPSEAERMMTSQEAFLSKNTVQEATNGWVAQHAQDLARRLRSGTHDSA